MVNCKYQQRHNFLQPDSREGPEGRSLPEERRTELGEDLDEPEKKIDFYFK
jgi:hypothetical protein